MDVLLLLLLLLLSLLLHLSLHAAESPSLGLSESATLGDYYRYTKHQTPPPPLHRSNSELLPPHAAPAFATTIGHVRKRAIAAVASKTVECKRHAIMSQHCTGHLSHCRHLKRQLFASRLEKRARCPLKTFVTQMQGSNIRASHNVYFQGCQSSNLILRRC